jgi:tRNA (guanine9-N1)-methyltransferase
MGQQINQSYGLLKQAKLQPKLLITSFGGRIKQKLDSSGDGDYKRWKKIEFEEKALPDLLEERVKAEEVIYLTADSPNVLETLDEGKTYVLGGIVDRNRYKVSRLLRSTLHNEVA